MNILPTLSAAFVAAGALLFPVNFPGPLLAAEPASDAAIYQWHDTPGKHLELRFGDQRVLRYMYAALDESSPQARYETYKVFHHLYDPSGKRLLTNGPTGDVPYPESTLYPHHRGLYYGFSLITYGDGKRADTWHCNQGESQQHVEVLASEGGARQGQHRVAIHWHGQDGKAFAREERQLTARLTEGGTVVDFVSSLESVTGDKMHLDGDPQHAGFQFRATNQVAKTTKDQTYYLRIDGKGELGEMRNWNHLDANDPINTECTNRPWNASSFVVDDQRYTVLYLDHPGNPKPAYSSERDYGRFGSFFVTDVMPGKPLVVRYRLWVQEGEMTVDQCEAMSREFLADPSEVLSPRSKIMQNAK